MVIKLKALYVKHVADMLFNKQLNSSNLQMKSIMCATFLKSKLIKADPCHKTLTARTKV